MPPGGSDPCRLHPAGATSYDKDSLLLRGGDELGLTLPVGARVDRA